MNVVYSYNKQGFEAAYWEREIGAASSAAVQFVPFNHGVYLDCMRYSRAQLLDNLYVSGDPALKQMYARLEEAIRQSAADVLVVDNFPPYHPEYLRRLPLYKVLRTTDGPLAAYDRDFAYQHAYDHVLYHSPAYSADLDMPEKLRYVGARSIDFWPLAAFDALHDPTASEEQVFAGERDLDIVFVGSLYVNKMPLLAQLKKAFGRSCHLYGQAGWKKNAYFNVKYGWPGWISPIRFQEYVPLYRRAKIGVNVHNRGDYTVGSYRLFDLPANGVMQISDGGRHLQAYYNVGEEIDLSYSAGARVAQAMDGPCIMLGRRHRLRACAGRWQDWTCLQACCPNS